MTSFKHSGSDLLKHTFNEVAILYNEARPRYRAEKYIEYSEFQMAAKSLHSFRNQNPVSGKAP